MSEPRKTCVADALSLCGSWASCCITVSVQHFLRVGYDFNGILISFGLFVYGENCCHPNICLCYVGKWSCSFCTASCLYVCSYWLNCAVFQSLAKKHGTKDSIALWLNYEEFSIFYWQRYDIHFDTVLYIAYMSLLCNVLMNVMHCDVIDFHCNMIINWLMNVFYYRSFIAVHVYR